MDRPEASAARTLPEKRITPRTLKGFRDHLPARAIPRERCVDIAKSVFRSFGFAPIDTPVLEYAEILLGKLDADAEIQRQIYRFTDQGGRDVALRFDLTVPFARFAAQHVGELGTPFKRYHVGPVWRGENTQAGRSREFVQCDVDIIGTTSAAADAEIVLVICALLPALGVEGFTVRVNDRRILSGLLEARGVADQAGAVLRAVDKLAKQGRDAVVEELGRTAGLAATDAASLLDLLAGEGTASEVLERAVAAAAGTPGEATVLAGAECVATAIAAAEATGAPPGRVAVDLTIARGLDYYTGIVFETFLDALPSIGSVCSGGRYDDLAGLYTKQPLPGVGCSLGLDRLLDALEALGVLDTSAATPVPFLLLRFDDDALLDDLALAAELREAGFGVEVYPDVRKVGDQLKYAERRGFRFALLAGPSERDAGIVKVKDLASREEHGVPRVGLVDEARRLLR